MLLEFKTSNFKSFKDEIVFSLIPAAKQKGLDYSIINKQIGNKNYKAICSSVIYGPNAAGKTNIISAIDTFKQIVLRGHINNSEETQSPNFAAYSLELIANNALVEALPVCFYIKFIEEEFLFEYSIKLDLGKFLEIDYKRKIVEEELSINSKKVFFRTDTSLEVFKTKELKEILRDDVVIQFDNLKAIALSNIHDNELFLLNGFKNIYSSKIVSILTNWFEKKLNTYCRADLLNFTKSIDDNKENSVYIEKTIDEAAKTFGINSNALGYVKNEESSKSRLVSVFNESKTAIPAKVFESYGTVRFVNIFQIILKILVNGGVLIVDEFDASIHPNVLMNIVNIFHNDEINIHHAQLIFNTHNPIFLNSSLFRRDEIKFVERDDQTHLSYHYSLSDFPTATSKNGPGVRKGEDYLNNYFIDKYGAIKDVDFSQIITRIVKAKKG
ncbi:MAG: ATP-binding protein [Sphaerochaetaceae bacterium]|nr:ATP-binding protein [Sphaerochaetaceae bacterium]